MLPTLSCSKEYEDVIGEDEEVSAILNHFILTLRFSSNCMHEICLSIRIEFQFQFIWFIE